MVKRVVVVVAVTIQKKNNSKKSIIDIIKEIDRQNGVKTALNNSNIMENPHKFENPNSSQNSLGL